MGGRVGSPGLPGGGIRMSLTQFLDEVVVQPLIEIRIFGSSAGPSASPLGRGWFHTAGDAAEYALKPEWQGSHVYFGVTPRKDRRGTKDAVRGAWTIWADVDHDLPDHALALPPSYIVRSGTGYHVYWRLESLATDPDLLGEGLQAAQAITAGDNVSDLTRLLRIPGTWNVKGEPPLPCEILQRNAVTYQLCDIIAIARVPKKVLGLIRSGDASQYPSRSERDWYLITSLISAGMTNNAIKAVYEYNPCGDKANEDDGHNLEFTLDKARKEVGATSGKRASFGLYERKGDGYFKGSAGGSEVRLSTFTMTPVALLSQGPQELLKANVFQGHKVTRGAVFPRQSFLSVSSLSKHLGPMDWQWLGTDRDVRVLGAYLGEACNDRRIPRQEYVECSGHHGDFWVGTDQVFTATQTWEASSAEAPLTFVPRTSEFSRTHYSFEDPIAGMDALLPVLLKINRPDVLLPVLGWYLATPFKADLEAHNIRFPILNIYGSRGSGKTTLVQQVMLPLLGIQDPVMHDCNTTRFVMLSLMGSTNAIPVALAEFRQSSLSQSQYSTILRTVLLSYDSGRDSRGNADQTITEYPLTAPFSIDGEDQLPDQAAKERVIAVGMSPNDISPGSEAALAFEDLQTMDLSFFAGPFIRWAMGLPVMPLWQQAEAAIKLAFPGHLPHRVRRNITVAYTGLVALKEYCDLCGVAFDLPEAHIMSSTVGGVVSDTGVSQMAVDEFVEDLINHFAIYGGVDFAVLLDTDRQWFWFHGRSAYTWWQQHRTRLRLGSLEYKSLVKQLKERSVESYVLGDGQSTNQPYSRQIWRMFGIDLFKAARDGLEIPQEVRKYDTVSQVEA